MYGVKAGHVLRIFGEHALLAEITRHATLIMLKRVYDRSNTAATRALIDKPIGTKTVQRAKRKPPIAAAERRKSS